MHLVGLVIRISYLASSPRREIREPRYETGGTALIGWVAATALALLLGLGTVGRAAAADTSITPAVAGLFVDEQKIVEGQVIDAEREANTVRLRLGHPPQSLTVSLIIGLLSNFPPDPEHYYLGKTVRVVGTIRSFRGSLEMVIHDPAHIEIAGAPPAGAPASDTAASNAAVRDTVTPSSNACTSWKTRCGSCNTPAAPRPEGCPAPRCLPCPSQCAASSRQSSKRCSRSGRSICC
jgi:hypothetical protein